MVVAQFMAPILVACFRNCNVRCRDTVLAPSGLLQYDYFKWLGGH